MGMSVKSHYCGGKLTSISILPFASAKCPCGKKVMKKDCCKDKMAEIKKKCDENQLRQNVVPTNTSFQVLTSPFLEYTFSLVIVSNEKTTLFHQPPDGKTDIPIFLLNRLLLI